jgi:cellulose synthase/poly-beta-1,6-N-acetylglucosamine synthase-like glycosyltransferase
MARWPGLDFVQFIDGDTLLVDGWVERAAAALANDPRSAVVSGRRREMHPEKSVFNRLCDVEWNKPVGKTQACEGDAMIRPAAFTAVGGFNPNLIAGEEPELCMRLRAAGWDILRIDADMTLHDAAMLRISQWWRREVRAGHAYAEAAASHGCVHGMRRSMGICFWGAILPLATLVLLWPTRGLSLLAAGLLLGVLVFRAWRGMRKRADSTYDGIVYAVFCALGKFPMFQGHLQFWKSRLTGRRGQLIEYKGPKGSLPRQIPAAPAAECSS